MKTLVLVALFALAPLAFADAPADLLKNSAVRGAVAHIKSISGAKSCEVHDVKRAKGQVDFYVSCNNPGDPAESERLGYGTETMGQIHVRASVLEGGALMLEKIEFNYAG